ncbi:MAG: hypothetical protein PGN07_08465 [Aeromicrobium erythreum]
MDPEQPERSIAEQDELDRAEIERLVDAVGRQSGDKAARRARRMLERAAAEQRERRIIDRLWRR